MSKIEFPLITAHFGSIDPESIEAYIAAGGYEALKRAVTGMTPEAVLETVERSGLQGPQRRRLPGRPQVAGLTGGPGQPKNSSSATAPKATPGPSPTRR